MASQVGFKDFSQLYYMSNEPFDAKAYITAKVGKDNIAAFELWAFNSTAPINYDESARFLWNQSHRGCPLVGSYKSAIMRICDYWQERFTDEWPKKDFGD